MHAKHPQKNLHAVASRNEGETPLGGLFLSVVGFIIVTVIWPALNVWILNKEKMSGLSFAFYLPKCFAMADMGKLKIFVIAIALIVYLGYTGMLLFFPPQLTEMAELNLVILILLGPPALLLWGFNYLTICGYLLGTAICFFSIIRWYLTGRIIFLFNAVVFWVGWGWFSLMLAT